MAAFSWFAGQRPFSSLARQASVKVALQSMSAFVRVMIKAAHSWITQSWTTQSWTTHSWKTHSWKTHFSVATKVVIRFCRSIMGRLDKLPTYMAIARGLVQGNSCNR